MNTHHVGSGFVNTVTQRRSVGLFTSDNPISIQAPLPTVPAVNTFLNIHRFGSELKKRLRFTRPLELSAIQLDILSDKASMTFDEITSHLTLTKKSIANATRQWIHAPRKLRAIKKSFKPIFIAFYKAQFNFQRFLLHECACILPCIPVDSTFNLIREALMLILTIVNYIVVPLNCAFENDSTSMENSNHTSQNTPSTTTLLQEISTVSAYLCFVNIVIMFFT